MRLDGAETGCGRRDGGGSTMVGLPPLALYGVSSSSACVAPFPLPLMRDERTVPAAGPGETLLPLASSWSAPLAEGAYDAVGGSANLALRRFMAVADTAPVAPPHCQHLGSEAEVDCNAGSS